MPPAEGINLQPSILHDTQDISVVPAAVRPVVPLRSFIYHAVYGVPSASPVLQQQQLAAGLEQLRGLPQHLQAGRREGEEAGQ